MIRDNADLLEILPFPCMYLDDRHTITRANAKARKTVIADTKTSLEGVCLSDTNFFQLHVRGRRAFDHALQNISRTTSLRSESSEEINTSGANGYAYNDKDVEDAFVLDVLPESSWQWHLSQCSSAGRERYCLIASPMKHSALATIPTTKEEEFNLFLRVCKPSIQVPYYTNAMAADFHTMQVNDAGKEMHTRLAAALERSRRTTTELGIFDESFTKDVTFEGAVGPSTMRQGHSSICMIRGIQDDRESPRIILDMTTNLLNNPYTNKPMGVLVQSRDGQDWADYLRRIDIYTRTHSTCNKNEEKTMLRSMLKSGEVDYVCDNWKQFTNQSRVNLLVKWKDWIHPDDLNKVRDQTASSFASGLACEYEIRIRKAASSAYRYFQDRLVPLKDDHGDILRWYYVSTDIHEFVLKRQTAQRASDRLFRIINNINVVLFEIDETRKVVSATGALTVKSVSGHVYTADQYIGGDLKTLCLAMDPNGVDQLVASMNSVLDGVTPKHTVDYHIGNQYLRTVAIAGFGEEFDADESGKKLYGLTMDVTAEHETEMAKLQLSAMAETEKMKQEFLANISHELRTPIAGLIGILELLNDTPLDEQQAEYLRILETSAQNLLVIVNDILDLSRAEATDVTIVEIPFEYATVLEEVCKANEVLAAKKGLQLKQQFVPFHSKTLGDPGRVRQILQNLLGNAIKFTSSGSISIETLYEGLEDSVRITTTITDTGIGIDSAALALLFRPFVQADRSTTRTYGGSGLGLSIARKFALKMGGDVTLHSIKGQGTTATFTLQLSYAQFETREVTDLDAPTASRGILTRMHSLPLGAGDLWRADCHILVVEDNKINQRVVLSHLKKLGFISTSCSENGAEAIEYVQQGMAGMTLSSKSNAGDNDNKPILPDLILMDCQMPILDGYEATRQLRNTYNYKRPIIALTASAIKGDKESCIAAGMNDHVAKPVSQKVLNEMLERWLRQS